MDTLRVPLHVVIYRDEGRWIAHCLEFDLIGDGETQDGALSMLTKAIDIQIEQSMNFGNAKNLFSPADGRFFEMFAAGKDIVVGELQFSLNNPIIESAEAREYSGQDLVTV